MKSEATMHLSEFDLRAYHDGELPAGQQAAAAAHLAHCPDCRAALAALAGRASRVHAALDALAPTSSEASRTTPSKAAWRTFEQRIQEKQPMSNRFARLRPLWIGLTVVAVLAIALSFAPVQAMASSFLQLFRVQQVTVLPIDLTSLKDNRFNPAVSQTISQFMTDQVKITRQPGKSHQESDVSAASKDAGFQVRLGSSADLPLSRIMFEPGIAFEGTFNQALAEKILQGMNKGNLQLPAGLDGAVIKANIPDAVTAAYGSCRFSNDPEAQSVTGSDAVSVSDNCLLLVQLPSPTVDTPPDLPVEKLANIGLQALGMSPDQASKVASSIDWTKTLVIPVPSGQVNSQTVSVDGVDGTLLTQAPNARVGTDSREPNMPLSRSTYTLVWVKNGIVYGIMGAGDTAKGIGLANSLK
jgi:hypothetical protein